MAVVIQNGNIVTGDETYISDIKVQDGLIKQIGNIEISHTDTIINAKNKYILSGAIDVHTHLDLNTGTASTADDFSTGSKAAIAGGTTMIIDFATQEKGDSLKNAVLEWDKKSAKGTFCDYGYHMAIIDWNESVKQEMQEMISMGITSFKMYMAYKGSLQVDDGIIYEALKQAKELGGLIGFHCENGDLISVRSDELISQGKTSPYYHQHSRPDILEEEAIYRIGEISKLTNTPVWVVHLSTKKGMEVIKKHRKDGTIILTETCPQYLLLDNSIYGKKDNLSFETAKYILSPPIRDVRDQKALWDGLKNKDIEIISTDHCSFNFKGQKELGKNDFSKIPNGIPGLEHRLSLLYTYGVCENKITINQMVKLLSENPADYFGIDNKGYIKEGKDADIIIFDPEKSDVITSKTQFQNLDYTPYEGLKRQGNIETVFLRGEKIYENNKFLNDEPTGKFVKRSKSSLFK